jgi:hypothetical protein
MQSRIELCRNRRASPWSSVHAATEHDANATHVTHSRINITSDRYTTLPCESRFKQGPGFVQGCYSSCACTSLRSQCSKLHVQPMHQTTNTCTRNVQPDSRASRSTQRRPRLQAEQHACTRLGLSRSLHMTNMHITYTAAACCALW